MSISFVLIHFLTQMAVGMMVTVSLLPSREVDSRFFKSISFWSFFFMAGSLILRKTATFRLPEIFKNSGMENGFLGTPFFLFVLFSGACLFLWVRLKFNPAFVARGILFFIASLGLLSLILDSTLYLPLSEPLGLHRFLIPFSFVSSSLLLGGFLCGMIFGHYYLVNIEMPKKLLVTMAWILIFVLGLRIISVAGGLFLEKWFLPQGENLFRAMISFKGHGIFFWERILVGLFIPSIVVGMIYATAKIGSNQSATGIMYVAVAFVFIGELVAKYLFLLSAIPL